MKFIHAKTKNGLEGYEKLEKENVAFCTENGKERIKTHKHTLLCVPSGGADGSILIMQGDDPIWAKLAARTLESGNTPTATYDAASNTVTFGIPKGPAGEPGPQGPQGPAGQDGASGSGGTDGEAGSDGADGKDGKDGKDGITWKPSVSEDGTLSWTKGTDETVPTSANIKGEQGPSGVAGGKGDTGPKGDPGPKGDTGPKGDQGLQGDKGEKGDTGPAGPQGPAGKDGITWWPTVNEKGNLSWSNKTGATGGTTGDGPDPQEVPETANIKGEKGDSCTCNGEGGGSSGGGNSILPGGGGQGEEGVVSPTPPEGLETE